MSRSCYTSMGAWLLWVCELHVSNHVTLTTWRKQAFWEGLWQSEKSAIRYRLCLLTFFSNHYCVWLCRGVANSWWILWAPLHGVNYSSGTSTSGLRWGWPRSCHMDARWVKNISSEIADNQVLQPQFVIYKWRIKLYPGQETAMIKWVDQQ